MKTKKRYEEWLNSISPPHNHEDWIIGGKIRTYYMNRKLYGKALRLYDPIGFEVGFREFLR